MRLPPAPPIAPANDVEVLSPPAVNALSFSNTAEPATPAKEPIVSELRSSSVAPLAVILTALPLGIAEPMLATNFPPEIVVPPV